MKCRTDETPAKICGGRVLEIGGREKVFVRGAGVDSVLQTVRIEAITQAGASGIDDVDERPLRRSLGDLLRWGVPLALLGVRVRFNGVALLGVSASGRC